MIKLAAIGFVTVLLAVFFKRMKNEYGIYAGIAGSILLLYLGVKKMSGIVDVINRFTNYISVDSTYIVILLKMLGIAYIAEFTANLSKDAGYHSIASQIELIGKLSILLISAPILEALLDTIFTFMN